jgi:hypothetical protein
MKLVITALLCAAAACSRESRPQTVQAAGTTTSPLQTALVATTQPGEPGSPGIPTNNPHVAPPAAEASPPPDQTPLTPASARGEPRPTSAQLVPTNPALDKADSPSERESVREIRELLAADKALSATARQITIVVRDGRVWLRGQVNTAEERAAVERAARQAGGVVDVRNELVVME